MKEILPSLVKNNIIRWLLIPAALVLIFIVWLVFIKGNGIPDEKVFSAISPHISESRTNFMNAVSFLGNHIFLIPANLLFIAYLIGSIIGIVILIFNSKKWSRRLPLGTFLAIGAYLALIYGDQLIELLLG